MKTGKNFDWQERSKKKGIDRYQKELEQKDFFQSRQFDFVDVADRSYSTYGWGLKLSFNNVFFSRTEAAALGLVGIEKFHGMLKNLRQSGNSKFSCRSLAFTGSKGIFFYKESVFFSEKKIISVVLVFRIGKRRLKKLTNQEYFRCFAKWTYWFTTAWFFQFWLDACIIRCS